MFFIFSSGLIYFVIDLNCTCLWNEVENNNNNRQKITFVRNILWDKLRPALSPHDQMNVSNFIKPHRIRMIIFGYAHCVLRAFLILIALCSHGCTQISYPHQHQRCKQSIIITFHFILLANIFTRFWNAHAECKSVIAMWWPPHERHMHWIKLSLPTYLPSHGKASKTPSFDVDLRIIEILSGA